MKREEKIGIIKMFQTAVMKPREYRDVLKVRKRTVVLYIMLVSFLLTFLGNVMPLWGFSASIGGADYFIKETLPDFEYKDGKFSIDNRIEIETDGIRIVVDDEVKEFKESDLDENSMLEVLVSKNNLLLKNEMAGQNMELDFADVGKGRFTNEDLADMKPFFYVGIAIALVFVFISMMIGYVLSSVIFAFCGKSIGRMMGKEETFRDMFIFAVMARTAVGIIDSMGNAAAISFFSSMTWIFIDFGIILVYLYLGIKGQQGKTGN